MLFTIGTSNRSLLDFLETLRAHAITQIIDLRSSPYSRFQWFNRGMISRWSQPSGILYREEGGVLGGRSEFEPTSDPYRRALERIIQASCREPVAMFCAEGDPRECHRSYEVGATLLAEHGIVVRNILRDGRIEDAPETFARTPTDRFPKYIRDQIIAARGSIKSGQKGIKLAGDDLLSSI